MRNGEPISNLAQNQSVSGRNMEALELPSVDVHCKTVMQNLHRLKCNEKLCDMALGADGQKFFAHKCVVLAACPILESFIDETQTEFPYVVCNEVSAKGLSLWIDYIYTGIAPLLLEEQADFIKVCDTFFMFGKPPGTGGKKAPSKETKKPGRKRGPRKSKPETKPELPKTPPKRAKQKYKSKPADLETVDFTLDDLIAETVQDVDLNYSDVEISDIDESPVKLKRGRGRKSAKQKNDQSDVDETPVKRKRGRKRKSDLDAPAKTTEKKERVGKTGRKNAKIPKEAPFICPKDDCDFIADDRPELMKHYKKHQQKKFKCKECGEAFLVYDLFKIHELSHDGITLPSDAPFKCPVEYCQVVCESQILLWRHYKHHGRTRFKCNYCEERFGSNRERDFHHISHGHKPIDCEICGMKFFNQAKYNAHKKKHMNGDDYQSLDNSMDYSSEDQTSHIHSAEDKENSISKSLAAMFPCQSDGCGKSFNTKDKLARHVRSHTEKRHQCQTCEEMFYYVKDLKAHERTHLGDRPFECPVCKKSFAQKAVLKNHLLVHSGSKGEICAICGLAYTYKKSLAQHIRNKHGKKPTYTCDVCGKGFDILARFTQHKEICVGTEEHTCELCGKTLKSLISFECHTARCTGVEFRCQACKLNFKGRALFKQHMIDVHVPNQSVDCLPLEYRHLVQSQQQDQAEETVSDKDHEEEREEDEEEEKDGEDNSDGNSPAPE